MLIAIGSAGAAASTTSQASISLAPIKEAAERRLKASSLPGSSISVAVDRSTRVINAARVHTPLATLGITPNQAPIPKAKAILAHYGSLFGISRGTTELGEPKVLTDPITPTEHIGMTHVYFQQIVDHVPVFDSSIGVHLSHDGKYLQFIGGSFIPEVSLIDDKAAISSEQAVTVAKVALPGGKLVQTPRLEVFAGASTHPYGPTARLAWFVSLTAGPLRASQEYAVDAVNGSVLNVLNKTFRTSFVIHSSKHTVKNLPGTLLTEKEVSEDEDATKAKTAMEYAHKFYQSRFHWTGCSTPAVADVHYGQSLKEAEWNKEYHEVVLGDGYPAATDVVGHEFTECATESLPSDESLEGEPGAIAEAFADTMGISIEAYERYKKGETSKEEPNWNYGEKVGGIRDPAEPGKYEEIPGHKDPGSVKEYVGACQDNNDIHENSTIISHAFYLLATKLSLEQADKVFFRMQADYLLSTPTFADAREAALESARNIAESESSEEPEKSTLFVDTVEAFNDVGLTAGVIPPEIRCESECAGGKAIALQAPVKGDASTVSMLATLYRARGELAQTSEAGNHFMPLYEANMGRISELESLDPSLAEITVNGLLQITPALNALMEGKGKKFTLSASEMAEIEAALKRLAQDDRMFRGGGRLAELVEHELKWLRLPSYAGMTYASGFKRLNAEVKQQAPPPSGTLIEDPNCEKPYNNVFQVDGFNVHTPGQHKPGEISPLEASGVACGTAIEKTGGEKANCVGKGTLNTELVLELPPGDKVRPTSELTNKSYVGETSGRAIACGGSDSTIIYGVAAIHSVSKPEECAKGAIACYESEGTYGSAEGTAKGQGDAWVEEGTNKRLVLKMAAAKVQLKGEEVPVGFGQFGVNICAIAGEPGTTTCGGSTSKWVHKNGEESQPDCPPESENGRYVVGVTDEEGKTTQPAASCVYWGERLHKETVDSGNTIKAVSCVSETSECVATDSKGNAYYSTTVSPTAAATWKSWTGPASPSEAVACPSSSVCVLADGKVGGGGAMYYAKSLGGKLEEAFTPTNGVLAVSCASTALCVDGQEGGTIRYSTNPASTSWTEKTIGTGSLNGVYCLSVSFCAAVNSAGELYVANTEAHIKEATGWKSTDIDGSTALHGVACTSTTSCLAIDGSGHILRLAINGSGEATAVSHDIDGSNDLTAITCTFEYTCVAGDSGGNVFVSSSSGATWSDEHMLGTDITSVSCASDTLCVAGDTVGHVWAVTPDGVSPNNTQVVDPSNALNAVTCVPASTAECAGADSKGNEWYAKNVTATAAGKWSSVKGPTTPGEAIACPSSALCVLADGKASGEAGGNIYYSTSLGGAWTEAYNALEGADAISCPSSSFCVAAEGGGEIDYSKKPASSEWTSEIIGSSTMKAVDCLSAAFCAVVDKSGDVHIATTETHVREGPAWKASDIDGSTALTGIACTATTSCLAIDGTGDILKLVVNSSGEATATKEDIDSTNNLTAITCTGETCSAVDKQGDVLLSANAGTSWVNELALGSDLSSVACPVSTLCVAGDTTGEVASVETE
jgi:Zn-dependent metalloprotease